MLLEWSVYERELIGEKVRETTKGWANMEGGHGFSE